MQQMPNMAAMAGEQQPQQQVTPDQVKQAQMQQQPEMQVGMLVQKMDQMLQQSGYYDLPENKNRRGEINKELMDIAQALLDGNAEFVKNSEIYQYIVSQKGQRDAMRPKEQQMEMPSMEGMV